MATKLVTEQMVHEAAEALRAEGVEPGLNTVKARIGVGSYTTIKKYLDSWKVKVEHVAAVQDMPLEVDARAHELARAVWAVASAQAQKEAQAARDAAAAAVAAIKAELQDALAEIARLERFEADYAEVQTKYNELKVETDVAIARATERGLRADMLEREIGIAHDDVRAVREEIHALRKQTAVETQRCAEKLVRLERELSAAREEAAELRGQIAALKSARK
ncbi:MAG: DNA-binding protein [Pseudomonadota bacterium]